MTTRPQPPCPELEKLAAVFDDSNTIGDFLEWMQSKGLVIAGYENDLRNWEKLVVINRFRGESGINRVLAEYYGIDLDEVERERRALLEWLREQHGDE